MNRQDRDHPRDTDMVDVFLAGREGEALIGTLDSECIAIMNDLDVSF